MTVLLVPLVACGPDNSILSQSDYNSDDDGDDDDEDDDNDDDDAEMSVNVVITGALIGPGKASSGDTWDGFGSFDLEILSDLASLVDPTWGAVLDMIDGELDYFYAPDPFGYAELNEGAGYGNTVGLEA